MPGGPGKPTQMAGSQFQRPPTSFQGPGGGPPNSFPGPGGGPPNSFSGPGGGPPNSFPGPGAGPPTSFAGPGGGPPNSFTGPGGGPPNSFAAPGGGQPPPPRPGMPPMSQPNQVCTFSGKGGLTFLAHLHFSAEELLLYRRRQRPRQPQHAKY